MNFKKMSAAAVALAMSVAMLAGCAPEKENESKASTPSNSSAATTSSGAAVATDKNFTYRMIMHNFGPWDENAEMVERWNKEYNVTFDMVYVETAQAADQIALMVASKDIPDVFQMIDQVKYFDDGIIGGWSEEFFRTNAPKLSKFIDDTDKSAWGISKFDGEKMYSVPGFRKYDTVACPMVWRDDWLKKVGITEIPKTLAQTEEALYKFTNEDPDGNGKKDTYGLSKEAMPAIYGAYGTFRGQWRKGTDGKMIYGDVMPEAKEALTTLNKWYKDGVLDPEFVTGENEGGYWAITHKFMNNQIGLTGMGSFYHWLPDMSVEENGTAVGEMTKQWMNSGNKGTYAMGYAPEGPTGKKGTNKGDFRKLRTTFSANVVKDEEKFGRLLQVIDDMNCGTPENSVEVNRGTLGKYSEISTFMGSPAFIAVGEAAKSDSINSYLSAIGAANTFAFIEEGGNLEYQEVAYAQQFAWADKEFADKNDGYTSEIFGSPASKAKYDAELKKILDTGFISIITGEKPIDHFDTLVKQWYDNGGEVLTKEAQEVYEKEHK